MGGGARTGTPTRDAEDTRSRILQAATAEFAAAGLYGARTARIAERARANQRMIYAYYGSKDGLFDAVLEHQVLRSQAAVTLDPADLPGYASQVFDFYRANPEFVRLALWQHLERPELMRSLEPVVQAMAAKIAAVGDAQAAGLVDATLPPARLLDHILALVRGNLAGHPGQWTDEGRSDLRSSVARLVAPPRGPRSGDGGSRPCGGE
jgi:AcrR family transcriptional regulator